MSNDSDKYSKPELVDFLIEALLSRIKEQKSIKIDFEIDKRRFFEELSHLYVYGIYLAIKEIFPSQFESVIKTFRSNLNSRLRNQRFAKEQFPAAIAVHHIRMIEYMEVWNDSLKRSKEVNDKSTLNNPLYCISKKASIGAFGNHDGMDVRIIMLYSGLFSDFYAELADFLKEFVQLKNTD